MKNFCLFGKLTIIFSLLIDTSINFLGGLDWEDNVFNWHPVLMSISFGLLFFSAIASNIFYFKNYKVLEV
jgi:hypothetical protein